MDASGHVLKTIGMALAETLSSRFRSFLSHIKTKLLDVSQIDRPGRFPRSYRPRIRSIGVTDELDPWAKDRGQSGIQICTNTRPRY